MSFVDSYVNKINVNGDKNFVFQFIDNEGNISEVIKTFEELLLPITAGKDKEIEGLRNELDDKKKIEGLQDIQISNLSSKLEALLKEYDFLKEQTKQFLSSLDGIELNKTNEDYQTAFNLFLKGDIVNALKVLSEVKMIEAEQRAVDSIINLAETRLLKAQILQLSNKYEEAGENYEKAIELVPCWKNYFIAANYFKYLNQFSKAEALYELALTKSKHELDTADTLLNLANMQKSNKEFKEAEKNINKSLIIYTNLNTDNDEALNHAIARATLSLGNLFYETNNIETAKKHLSESLKAYKGLKHENSSIQYEYALALNSMAALHNASKQFKDANDNIEESIKILRRLDKKDSKKITSQLAKCLNNAANGAMSNKNFKKAKEYQEESLSINRELVKLNPNSYLIGLSESLLGLGILHHELNNFDEAKKLYQEALDIDRKLVETNAQAYNPKLVKTLSNYAILLFKIEDFTTSDEYFQESLSILKGVVFSNIKSYVIPPLIHSVINYAVLNRSAGNVIESENLYQESLGLLKKFAKLNPVLALPLEGLVYGNIANLKLSEEKYDEAETSFNEAIRIYRKLSKSYPEIYLSEVALNQNNLGILFMKTNRIPEAYNLIVKAFNIREALVTKDPQVYQLELADTCILLSNFFRYKTINRKLSIEYASKACKLYSKYIDISPYAKKWMKVGEENLEYWKST